MQSFSLRPKAAARTAFGLSAALRCPCRRPACPHYIENPVQFLRQLPDPAFLLGSEVQLRSELQEGDFGQQLAKYTGEVIAIQIQRHFWPPGRGLVR